MSFPALEETIRDLVKKDDLEKAIAHLFAHVQNEENLEQITLLSARYYSLQNDDTNGIIDYEAFQKPRNQLRINVLSFAKKSITPAHTIENQYRVSLTRISILWVLYQEKKDPPSLNVTKILALTQLKNRKYVADSIYEMEKYDLVNKQKVEAITCWKLTEKGVALAQEFANSLLFNLERK